MSKQVVVRVSQDAASAIKLFAKARKITVNEAADRLISTAVGRMNAVKKHAARSSKRVSAPRTKRGAKAGSSVKKTEALAP